LLTHPIHTVIFDLDGTLRHNIPSADEVQYGYALQLGVDDKPGKQHTGARWAHYYWAQSAELATDLTRYGELSDGFWAHYSFRYLLALEVAETRALALAPQLFEHMRDSFEPQNHVGEGVPETLQAIRDGGYTLGLVSNRTNPCQEECERLGLLGYFDFAYVAGEVDAWKPDPRIFERALQISACAPERVLYVGDNYYADVLGARSAGLQSVLLDPDGIFPFAANSANNDPTSPTACAVIRSIPELGPLLF